jgi:hemerythrin
MEQHKVEGRGLHREEHRRLLRDIRNPRGEDEVGSISLILRYLQECLLRHVDGRDKELGRQLEAPACR